MMMVIDLKKFAEEEKVVIPIVNRQGTYKKRKINARVEDGWYKIILGNKTRVERKASLLEIELALAPLKKLQVYALGTEGIPINFDNLYKKGFGESVTIHFMNLPLFSVAEVVIWEDKQFYCYGQKNIKNSNALKRVEEAFDRGDSLLDVRGVTPELRYYFLVANLQKDGMSVTEMAFGNVGGYSLSEDERKKRVQQLQQTFPQRLKSSVEKAGGTYIGFKPQGKDFLVEWEVGGQRVKTVIKDSMEVISGGYCLSGQDRKHSITSIVALAQLFQDRSPLYITRD